MQKLLLAGAAFGCLMAGAVGYSPPAYAADEVLNFTESGGNLTAEFSADPTAPITITTVSPEDWNISIAGSGHTISIDPNTDWTISWIEPDSGSPTTYNNLHYNGDDQTFSFVSDSTSDAGGASTFGNGTSDCPFSCIDTSNGDLLFFNTHDDGDAVVPEPASMSLLGFGLVGLGALRRRWRT